MYVKQSSRVGMWKGGVSGWMWGDRRVCSLCSFVALGVCRARGGDKGTGFGLGGGIHGHRVRCLFPLGVSRRGFWWPVKEISVMLDVGSESGSVCPVHLDAARHKYLSHSWQLPLGLDLRGPWRGASSFTSPSPTTQISIACHRGIHPRLF